MANAYNPSTLEAKAGVDLQGSLSHTDKVTYNYKAVLKRLPLRRTTVPIGCSPVIFFLERLSVQKVGKALLHFAGVIEIKTGHQQWLKGCPDSVSHL